MVKRQRFINKNRRQNDKNNEKWTNADVSSWPLASNLPVWFHVLWYWDNGRGITCIGKAIEIAYLKWKSKHNILTTKYDI